MEPNHDNDFQYAVIVTTFRRTTHLAEALQGIASQSLAPSRVIVADDGSGEPFESENEALAAAHGFTYLQLPHSGLPGLARDRALAFVTEPWLALSDDDDVWDADHIERLRNAITAEAAMVAGNARRSDGGGHYRPDMAPLLDIFEEFPRNPVITSACMMRTDALVTIGGFTPFPRGAEDYAAWLRLGTVGKVAIVNRPSVMYRITEGSLSALASSAKRPFPLLCALDFVIWSAGKRTTLSRVPTKLWTTCVRLLLLRSARAHRRS